MKQPLCHSVLVGITSLNQCRGVDVYPVPGVRNPHGERVRNSENIPSEGRGRARTGDEEPWPQNGDGHLMNGYCPLRHGYCVTNGT
jgi:hypothetical protein